MKGADMALDIPAIVKKGLNTAHTIAESVSKTGEILHKTEAMYNPATGEVLDTVLHVTVRCFVFDYNGQELNEKILRDDKKALVDKEEGMFLIDIRDQIKIDGVYYDIIDINKGATENFYVLQIRKTQKPLE
ncbi:hypothetical protein KKC59_04640 [bacterium]|nr:hypothetical protein [bacterium]